jgi:hypothetical protein
MSKLANARRRARTASPWLVALGALGFLGEKSSARAVELDPMLAHAFTLTKARVSATTSFAALPRNPSVKWRVRVAGGISQAPSVAQDGAVLLALSTPTLVQYDARGRLAWSARLGASPAALSAIVLGDGSRLVLTLGAEALVFSAGGRLLRHTTLPLAGLDAAVSVAPSSDGGLWIGAGRRLLRLDATLGVGLATRLDQDIRSVLAGSPPLVVTSNGSVFEITPEGEALRRGSFAGRVDAVARLAPRRLAAVLDGHRLSELDLDNETLTTHVNEPDLELSASLSSNTQGELLTLVGGEFLVLLGADGREKFRAALPALDGLGRPTSNDVLLGPDGSALVARAGLDLVAVQPDGGVYRMEGSACAEPLRPATLAQGSVVYACRSGIVLRLDDAPATDKR